MGALVRHPGRRQAVRPGRRRRRAGPHPDRDRPAVPRRCPRRRATPSRPPRPISRARPRQAPRPTRSRSSSPRRPGRKQVEGRGQAQVGEGEEVMTGAASSPASSPAAGANTTAWHALTPDAALAAAGRRHRRRADLGRRRCAPREGRLEHVHGGQDRLARAAVRPPVRRPDADRAARRRHRVPLPARSVLHRADAAAPHAGQRGRWA